jgi:hypothetical protein
MLTFLGLLNNPQPNDTSNVNRLMRDTFVEFLATTLFVFNGKMTAGEKGPSNFSLFSRYLFRSQVLSAHVRSKGL